MDMIIWLICALLVIAAVLGLVKAVLALEPFASFQPYANVIYALIVLLCVLLIVQGLNGGPVPLFGFPRARH